LPGGDVVRVPQGEGIERGTAIKMLVRPEDLQLSQSQAPGENCLQGVVTFVRDVGATIETVVECSGLSLTALSTPSQCNPLSLGDSVSVTLPMQACRVLRA
jgi:putative spermidine/putrescine transport system ATP-binding protein